MQGCSAEYTGLYGMECPWKVLIFRGRFFCLLCGLGGLFLIFPQNGIFPPQNGTECPGRYGSSGVFFYAWFVCGLRMVCGCLFVCDFVRFAGWEDFLDFFTKWCRVSWKVWIMNCRECMMRNIPDLSGEIEKMFFLWRGRDRRCGKFPNLSGA